MTAQPETLLALAARCEEGSGGDRELDALIWRWRCQSLPRSERWNFPPAYTSSLDAAVSFVERALPGWSGFVGFGGQGNSTASLIGPLKEIGEDFDGAPVEIRDEEMGEAASPARALLAAILRALSEKGRE